MNWNMHFFLHHFLFLKTIDLGTAWEASLEFQTWMNLRLINCHLDASEACVAEVIRLVPLGQVENGCPKRMLLIVKRILKLRGQLDLQFWDMI